MITIKSFLALYSERLSSRYEASECKVMLYRLLEEQLQLSHTELLLLDKDTALSAEAKESLCHLAERLVEGEPLQYVLGYAYFFEHKLSVSPAVLIPRPETEELVCLIQEDIVRGDEVKPLRVLDIGTGSACIPLGLAARVGSRHIVQIDAIDLSVDALSVARHNVQVAAQEVPIRLYEADVFDLASPFVEGGYDIIVSNPPYIHPIEAQEMSESVLQWEPSMALFAPAEEPTKYYDAIADLLRRGWLRRGGRVYLELNPLYAQLTLERMQSIIGKEHISRAELRRDLSGKERFLVLSLR